jgi:hypothetical protein
MRVKFTVAGVEDFEDMALDLEAVPREGETNAARSPTSYWVP